MAVATLISIALSALVFFPACQWVENGYPDPTFIASRDCEDLNREVLAVTDLFISKSNGERDITLQVEVADEPSERKQGLMCRESIPSGTGCYSHITRTVQVVSGCTTHTHQSIFYSLIPLVR